MSRLSLADIVERAEHEPFRLWQCPTCRKVRVTVTPIDEMFCMECLEETGGRVAMKYKAIVMHPLILEHVVNEGIKRERMVKLKNAYGPDFKLVGSTETAPEVKHVLDTKKAVQEEIEKYRSRKQCPVTFQHCGELEKEK